MARPKNEDPIRQNLGTRRVPKLRMADFPNADDIVRQGLLDSPRAEGAVDIMLVNPPTPDGQLWIRTQHRVGRRTRENMVWPQVSLAQMAALLDLDPQRFQRRYVRLVGIRKSLIEMPNFDCVFFDRTTRRCRVYKARPRQCRTWPFWASNLRTPETWERTCDACPGANLGPLIPLSEIQARRDAIHV